MDLMPKNNNAPFRKWMNILFYLSLAGVIFSAGCFFAVNYFLKENIKRVENMKEESKKIASPEYVNMETQVKKSRAVIDDFNILAGQHLKTVKIFPFLEKYCHPNVWFSQFNLNARQDRLEMTGEARNFESLGQQLIIFKRSAPVASALLDKVAINKDGKIDFSISISFNSGFLK